MKQLTILFGTLFFIVCAKAFGQVSADCVNAIPICNDTPTNGGTDGFGIDDFNSASFSGCLEKTITDAIESNSAWYRFRTGATGQLGFNISVNNAEDWDYALYKTSDCNSLGEPIRCNFYDNQDKNSFLGIGEDPTGNTANIQYEDWIEVAPGEDYYLLINNFSNNNSGFSIQFSGHIFVTDPHDALDCSIVSNLLGSPITACEETSVTLDATTRNAITYNWFQDIGTGFQVITDENSAELVVSSAANYRVEVIRPAGNTIISDVSVVFSKLPTAFPVSEIVACSEAVVVDLSLKDSEALGNQSADDFIVTYHKSETDANNGVAALSKELAIPVSSIAIYVRVTSLENPNCYDASEEFQLIPLETPVLDFSTEIFICHGQSSITIGAEIARSSYSYSWNTGETTPSIDVDQAGSYSIMVTNTKNGLSCSNTKTVIVVVSNPPVISNIEIEDLLDKNIVTVFTEEEGNWEYRLDEDAYQNSPEFTNVLPGRHTVTINDKGGCGAVTEEIIVVGFPKFFTPNGDDKNDYWHIAEISILENPTVFIYDRFGKLLTQLTTNSAGWDGTFGGENLPSTDYWFKLTYEGIDGQVTEAKYVNNHFSLKR